MSKGDFRLLIGVAWLIGSLGAHAQSTLYTNGTNYSLAAACQYTSACTTGSSLQDAQQFTLQGNSAVSSMTVALTDNNPNPADSIYNWAVYSEGANGLPTGAKPLVSGMSSIDGKNGSQYTYTSSWAQPTYSWGQYYNYLTVNTGSLDLASGSYYFTISGSGLIPPEGGFPNSFEGWVQSATNTGAAVSNKGVWSAGTDANTVDGLSLTVTGSRIAAAVPELSPSTSIASLTLLLGMLMVSRGRSRPMR
jgi:hypothetical protein